MLLQGAYHRKLAKKETREFYINAAGSVESITSSVGGVSFTITPAMLEQILSVPNSSWCYYLKCSWPIVEGISTLEISRHFSNDSPLKNTTRVDRGSMSTLHKLVIDMVHKVIVPRKEKHTEANYLDLTIMEILVTKAQINLPKLIL